MKLWIVSQPTSGNPQLVSYLGKWSEFFHWCHERTFLHADSSVISFPVQGAESALNPQEAGAYFTHLPVWRGFSAIP